jgi:hypothetical protein
MPATTLHLSLFRKGAQQNNTTMIHNHRPIPGQNQKKEKIKEAREKEQVDQNSTSQSHCPPAIQQTQQ